jgi:hypothetical protein
MGPDAALNGRIAPRDARRRATRVGVPLLHVGHPKPLSRGGGHVGPCGTGYPALPPHPGGRVIIRATIGRVPPDGRPAMHLRRLVLAALVLLGLTLGSTGAAITLAQAATTALGWAGP